MSLRSWLQSLRHTLAPGRTHCHHQRKGSRRPSAHRPNVEVLEDRNTPSFTWGGDYPIDDFDQMAPNFPFSSQAQGPGVTADFNSDGQDDLFSISWPGMGDVAEGNVFLGRADGTFVERGVWGSGGNDPVLIGTGDLNGDGRPDLAIMSWNSSVAGGYDVQVLLNDGNWGWGPNYFLDDATVAEGNTGTTNAIFTLSLAQAANVDLTFRYYTADGTAIAGSDYQAVAGTLTIPAGQTAGTITVPVNGDSLPEWYETFRVYLSSPSNADLTMGYATGTIVDDESHISIGDVTITEGNTGTKAATFTVILDTAGTQPITVAYATADGTATAASDYQAVSGTVIFAPGETSKTVTVPVIGDRLPELNETFVMNLSSPTNATIADGQGVGTIVDDEPRISINNVTKYEGTAKGNSNKTTSFTFTVTLSAAYDQAVTMSFKTTDGTATTGDGDYVAKTGTLTFAPGETTKTLTIEVKADNKREANETFYLDLFGNSGNALFTKNRGIGTILNDD